MHTISELTTIAGLLWPGRVYRYMKFNQSRLEQILLENRMYHSAPSGFEDPDCKSEMKLPNNDKEWLDLAKASVRKYNPKYSKKRIKQTAQARIAHGKFKRVVRKNAENMWEDTGILCLTLRNNNQYMWEKYASNSTGICLEFSPGIYQSDFFTMLPVQYEEELPRIDLMEFVLKDDDAVLALFIKTKDLSYEEEWRVWKDEGPGLYEFSPQRLTGVIFGSKMEPRDESELREVVADRGVPLKLYRAVEKVGDEEVEIVPL